MKKWRKLRRKRVLIPLSIIALGFIVPDKTQMPVVGASASDYHPDSFWYYPWGKSVTHKGVDIFAKAGTTVNSCSYGIVLYTGTMQMGGNVVFVLGPKWRVHYYAHLESIETQPFAIVAPSTSIGKVGDSGNARGKSPHLHYSITSLVPLPWRVDGDRQGWKKMFYLNPIEQF